MIENLNKEELIDLVKKLEKENKELKEKLYGNEIQLETTNQETRFFSNEEKIKIFMSVFKGRTDLYAKRWVSNKTGKSGYSPVCRNEFSMTKCDKPRIKCSECPYRELLPLTEEIILKHLQGKLTIGIYPLLPGDMCNFLAIDFDKRTYEKDVTAFWNTCDELPKKENIKDIILEETDSNHKPRIILATSSSIGEGFDDSRLDTLFLTMPVSWKGRIIQYVGRLHREHEDKEKIIVYDYLDDMRVLEKMYERRLKGYKIAGYEILE